MREHLVPAIGAGGEHRDGLDLSDQLNERVGPCLGGIVGEHIVVQLPDDLHTVWRKDVRDLVRLGPDEHRVDRCRRAGSDQAAGEAHGLEGRLGCDATVMLDDDQHRMAAHARPNATSMSTTAGAALAPVPSTIVSVTCSTGFTNRSGTSPPG